MTVVFLNFSDRANLHLSERSSSRAVHVFLALSLDEYSPHSGLFFVWFSNEIGCEAVQVINDNMHYSDYISPLVKHISSECKALLINLDNTKFSLPQYNYKT